MFKKSAGRSERRIMVKATNGPQKIHVRLKSGWIAIDKKGTSPRVSLEDIYQLTSTTDFLLARLCMMAGIEDEDE